MIIMKLIINNKEKFGSHKYVEIKAYSLPLGQRRYQNKNENILWDELKLKHNILKLMR